jgi:hypothetical protein
LESALWAAVTWGKLVELELVDTTGNKREEEDESKKR